MKSMLEIIETLNALAAYAARHGAYDGKMLKMYQEVLMDYERYYQDDLLDAASVEELSELDAKLADTFDAE